MKNIRFSEIEELMTYIYECSVRSWEIYFKNKVLNIPIPPRAGYEFPLQPFIHGDKFKIKLKGELETFNRFFIGFYGKEFLENFINHISEGVIHLYVPNELNSDFVDFEEVASDIKTLKKIEKNIQELCESVDHLNKSRSLNHVSLRSGDYTISDLQRVLELINTPRKKKRYNLEINIFDDLHEMMPWHSGRSVNSTLPNLRLELEDYKVTKLKQRHTGLRDNYEIGVLWLVRETSNFLKDGKSFLMISELPYYKKQTNKKINSRTDRTLHSAKCVVANVLEFFKVDDVNCFDEVERIHKKRSLSKEGLSNIKLTRLNLSHFENQERFQEFKKIPHIDFRTKSSQMVQAIFNSMRSDVPRDYSDLIKYKKRYENIWTNIPETEIEKRISLNSHHSTPSLSSKRSILLGSDSLYGPELSPRK